MADNTVQDVDPTVDVDTSAEEAALDDGTSFETEDDNQEDVVADSDDTSDFDEGADDDVAEEPKEKEEESKAKDETEESEEETVDEIEEDTTSKDTKKGEPDTDKAREAFKERELRRQIQKEEREKQERITLDRYLDEAKDDEAELESRALQVERYNINKEKAALNEQKLTSDISRAKADIELLRDTNPIVQEELGNALDEFQAMYVVQNEQGDIVEIKGDVYQHLQKKADSIKKLRGIGARDESKAKTLQKSRAMTTPSAKPKEGKKDEGLDAFDEEANRY